MARWGPEDRFRQTNRLAHSSVAQPYRNQASPNRFKPSIVTQQVLIEKHSWVQIFNTSPLKGSCCILIGHSIWDIGVFLFCSGPKESPESYQFRASTIMWESRSSISSLKREWASIRKKAERSPKTALDCICIAWLESIERSTKWVWLL